MSTTAEIITKIYIGYFDRAPDPDGLNYWIGRFNDGMDYPLIAQSFSDQVESTNKYPYLDNPLVASPDTFLNSVYMNLFERAPDADGLAYWKAQLDGGRPVGEIIFDIINGATDTDAGQDATILANKTTVAYDWVQDAANKAGLDYENSATAKAAAADALDGSAAQWTTADYVTTKETATDAFFAGSQINGETYSLTAGINNIVGTSNNDMFDATETATAAATFTNLDSLDGGDGVDTLKIVQSGAVDTTAIVGAKVANIENINITSGAAVTTNTTAWTGATALTVAAGSNVNATAALTTDVTVGASALTTGVVVNGGKDVTVTAADTSTTGAASGNAITVGGTSAAAGVVNVTYTETISDAGNGGVTGGTVGVTGGTSVVVNSLAVAGTGSNAADALTIGAVGVTGAASTTDVTVKQTAATAAYDGTANKNIKITNGAVTISDGHDATGADTIKTVTLENYGASSITSTVLDTLTVKGGTTVATASGTLALNQSLADTSTAATTLALSASGMVGVISGTQAAVYKTVDVTASAATTIGGLTMGALTNLNVGGEGVTTISALTAGNLASITSTGAGLTIAPALATGVAFTGGDGVETISVGATTKAIATGAGNDVVTISTETLGAGGSVDGGAGTDTLVANTNTSNIAGLPQFTGFETLRVAGGAAQGSHNANGFTALEVGTIGGGNVNLTNVATGTGLTQLATMGNDLTYTLANGTGTADVLDFTMKSAGAIGSAGDTITMNGVETLNITLEDTDTTAHVNTVEIVDGNLKTVTVSGDAGLTVVNAPASITSFDASGVVLDKVTDTGITFTSTNSTVAETVSITGSNGVDVLTGSATAIDTIKGGDGADTLRYVGGADVHTGGAGNDVFDVNAAGTKAAHLTIADATAGDTIDFAGITTGTLSNAGAFGAATTLGAAATFDQYLNAAADQDGSTNAVAEWFQFEGNTYVVISNDDGTGGASAGFTDGTDAVVQLTGLVDLSNDTFAAEVLTIV